MMSPDPPPLPEFLPVRCARFESHKSGVFSIARDRSMIEEAQNKALQWLEKNPELDIVSIDTACGRLLTVVTVWYR